MYITCKVGPVILRLKAKKKLVDFKKKAKKTNMVSQRFKVKLITENLHF